MSLRTLNSRGKRKSWNGASTSFAGRDLTADLSSPWIRDGILELGFLLVDVSTAVYKWHPRHL